MQLLEINLIQTPQVADAILANGVLTHYDRPRYFFTAPSCHACPMTSVACHMLQLCEVLSASVWVESEAQSTTGCLPVVASLGMLLLQDCAAV